MPVFRYRAVNNAGRTLRGSLTAANEADLYQRLGELRLELVDAKPASDSRLSRLFASSVRTRDLIEFCIYMGELVRVGVPVAEALKDIRESTGSIIMRDVLNDVVRDLSNGEVLSEALSHHPRVFNRVFVGVIGAGERTGGLDEAFAHLLQHLKWQEEMNVRLRAAARYPAFVLATTLLLVLAMMLFLVPELSRFLGSLQMELPMATVALLATSDFVSRWWWLILALPVVLLAGGRFAYRSSEQAAYLFDYYAYRLPIVGETMRKIALSRFAHFFALMYRSGIGILECLEAARGVVANRAMGSSLGMAKGLIEQGTSLTNALRSTGEFPDLVVRMVKVGEESGNLNSTLENVSYFYDREVEAAVQQMVSSVQPVLTLVVGVIMAWIILSVLGPMYDSFSQLPL